MIKIKKYQIEDYISDATQEALDLKADLVDGKVPASQLPSFVDDVIEVANYAALPIPGATGVIYITLDTNKVYRWTGSVYVEIASGSTNLSYTPGISDGTVNSDTGTDATIPLAGVTNAGLFSAAEKTKLAGIATGANVGVVPNAPITGATKTKITYDSKGLVTAGVDATTADIADSTNKRYVTDANLVVIGNTSGTNTGDQDLQSVLDNGNISTINKGIYVYVNYADEGALNGYNSGLEGTGVFGYSDNVGGGVGVYGQSDAGTGVFAFGGTGINGKSIVTYGNGSIGIEVNLGNSNKGLVVNSGTSSTGNFIELNKNGVDKLIVNQAGELTATKLIKEGGFDFQFLKADGSVDNNTYLTSADLPSTLDLYATTSPDPVISGYTALVRNITDSRYNTVAVDVPTPTITGTIASPTFCGAVISDPSILLGNPGVFNFSVIGKIRRTGGSTSSGADFFFSIYKRDTSGVETLIADSSPVVVPANGGVYVEYISIALWNNGIFLSTDRVVLKFYGIKTGGGSGATYEFLFGGGDPVRGTAAISSAIIPNLYLRDLADVEKTDALNNEVLYWNDADSLWEHSLVVDLTPDASATQKGLVTTGTQTFAGVKTFTSTINATSDNDYAISAISTNSDGLSAETTNGNGVVGISTNGIGGVFVTTNNANIAQFQTGFDIKVAIKNDGKITATAGTASTDVVVKSQLDTKQNTITLSAIGAVPNANAATLTGSVLNLQPASLNFGGVVTTGDQTFAGTKTFLNTVVAPGYSYTGGNIFNYSSDTFYVNTVNRTHYFGMGNGFGPASISNNLSVANGTFSILSQTASTIASFDANKNVVSLPLATYPSLTELALLKGVTGSSVQTQLNGKQNTITLTTTGSSGAATLIGSTLNIPQYSGGSSAQSAFTVLANNTASSAVPTEQVFKDVAQQTYTETPTWSGSSPTTILANTYKWSQVGNVVTVRISLSYDVGASSTSVILPMPADMPIPASITGFTGNSNILSYGSGMMLISTTSTAVTGARNCLLRRNSANNGYEFFVNVSIGVTVKVVIVNLTYFA